MYIPSAHKIDDPGLIVELMRQHPFAILVTSIEGVPVATHLPILVEGTEPIILCGHMARQNQQWKSLAAAAESLIIFAGPHGYVSPRFYESHPNVPTWNYVTIHAYGTVELIEEDAEALEHLGRIVATFDPSLSEAQPDSTDPAFYQRLLPGIVAFRFTVTRVDAKAKLNQNKAEGDRLAIKSRYEASNDPEEQQMARLMSERSSSPNQPPER